MSRQRNLIRVPEGESGRNREILIVPIIFPGLPTKAGFCYKEVNQRFFVLY